MDNDALSNAAHRGVSMRTNADRLLVAVLSAIFLFASHWAAEAARTTIGKAFAVEGSSKVLHPGKPQEEDLKKQDPVALEDRVRTLPQSRAYVVLHDKSSFSLAQESIVFLNDFGVEQKATYFHGHVAKGLVRFVKKLRVTKPSSSYVITTPTALIAVEPTDEEGDFLVEVLSELQTNLTVLHGKVRLKNIVEEIPGERMLEPGQTALVVAGKEPSSVFQSTKEGMEGLVQSSTIPGTLPTDNIPEVTPPSPEPSPQPPAPQPIPPSPGPAPEPPGPEPTPVPPEPWPPEPPSPWPPGPWPPGPWPPAPIPQPVCPCPAGFAMDAGGTCRPCAPGAVYNPLTCGCECLCPPGTFANAADGTCTPQCPTQMPIAKPGLAPPNPNVMPNAGCPECACCDDAVGCYLSFLGDASCGDGRCGNCPGPTLPADPLSSYPCPKCCDCDQAAAAPGNPCGINAAGLATDGTCGPGQRCISMLNCLMMGGYFIQTETVTPGMPCWVCQVDMPTRALKFMGPTSPRCPNCTKLTYRRGRPECVPVSEGKLCYECGKCGVCKKGKCVEKPPCPPDTVLNEKCECEPVVRKRCDSDEQCRKATGGLKPCCVNGVCKTFIRCPDGTYRCRCPEPPPEPYPTPYYPPYQPVIPTVPEYPPVYPVIPTVPEYPSVYPVIPTLPTYPSFDTVIPTLPTYPSFDTVIPTVPTYPSFDTVIPTVPTYPSFDTVIPTVPTYPSFDTVIPTVPTYPSFDTVIPTVPTYPSVYPVTPTLPTYPSFDTVIPTVPTSRR